MDTIKCWRVRQARAMQKALQPCAQVQWSRILLSKYLTIAKDDTNASHSCERVADAGDIVYQHFLACGSAAETLEEVVR